jgi:hypothetical protein
MRDQSAKIERAASKEAKVVGVETKIDFWDPPPIVVKHLVDWG